jgi:hypothetical protein
LALGLVHIATNRAAEGIVECEQALSLDQNLADAHAGIGWAKFLLGRGAETEGHIHEALRLSPRDIGAFRWMMLVGIAKSQSVLTRKRSRGCVGALMPTATCPKRISTLPLS